jgi:hypothetical protein
MMEDQPKPPQYVTALKLEFEDDGKGPPALYRIIGRGTQVECRVIADRVPDITYNGPRTVLRGTVIVVEAPEIEAIVAVQEPEPEPVDDREVALLDRHGAPINKEIN